MTKDDGLNRVGGRNQKQMSFNEVVEDERSDYLGRNVWQSVAPMDFSMALDSVHHQKTVPSSSICSVK